MLQNPIPILKALQVLHLHDLWKTVGIRSKPPQNYKLQILIPIPMLAVLRPTQAAKLRFIAVDNDKATLRLLQNVDSCSAGLKFLGVEGLGLASGFRFGA